MRLMIGLLSLAVLAGSARARDALDVPLVIRSDDGAVCQQTGTVAGLDPRGDGFLSVLAAPGGPPFREIDRVYNGQPIRICTQRGPWLGVIYGRQGSDCPAPLDWVVTQAYTGPCPHGWVHRSYVRPT